MSPTPYQRTPVKQLTNECSLVELSDVAWPASPPPKQRNLESALNLCADLMGIEATNGTLTHLSSGWSLQDCIKVDFPSCNFVVKIPREASTENVSLCRLEAVKTAWAAEHSTGPALYAVDNESGAFAMECIQGVTLSPDLAKDNLDQVTGLLTRIHGSAKQPWMAIYNPISAVAGYLDIAKTMSTMPSEDIELVELVLEDTKKQIGNFHSFSSALVPCHNDFHCHNVMVENNSTKRLLAIDFEYCDIGDAMWDLAYLTVDLELEHEPLALAEVYGASEVDQERLAPYVPLAIAHCAVWTANNGPAWLTHHNGLMQRLRNSSSEHKCNK